MSEELKKKLKKLIDENFFDVPPNIFYDLGVIFLRENNIISAKFYLEKFLEKENNIQSIIHIAALYFNKKLYDDLLLLMNEKINSLGKIKEFFYYKSWAQHKLGKTWLAIININKAIKIDADYVEGHFARLSYFPYIYKNNKEILKFRSYYEKNLDLFIKKFINKKKLTDDEVINITSKSINFLLPYQGFNDKELQIKYSKILDYFFSFLPIPNKSKKNNNKINIGFVSFFMYQHTITNLFKNWILNLDKDIFNISLFNCGNLEDDVTNSLKEFCHKYYKCNYLNEQISTINSECLDIIIYFDMGMDATTQLLSVARLAKHQFVTWGHPNTTGSDKMDYFLSSELMEKDDAQNFYTEKLVKLKGLGISYDFDTIDSLNISETSKIISNYAQNFLCLQNLIKIVPDNDVIFSKILSLNFGLSFISDRIRFINDRFYRRINKVIENHAYDSKNKLHFINRGSRLEFLKTLNSYKIILDTLSWSGGNTHLEALYLNKPIITMEGKSLRSNHTSALLKLINLNELIAKDENDYIKIAKNLIVDDDYRLFIVKKIIANKYLLFNNKTNSFNDYILNFVKNMNYVKN